MELYILLTLLVLAIITLIIVIINIARFQREIQLYSENINSSLSKQEQLQRDEFARNREEMGSSLRNFGNLVLGRMDSFGKQLNYLTEQNEQKLDKMRETIELKLNILREDNNKKLEKMRETVDEKLHATLEQRLGESFKQVSERLEQVHKSLGEMQTLAHGVGDLKKVLSNVKNRGTLGEIQLENILEQMLTNEQYEKNVATKKGSGERVEFALKLPGRSGEEGTCVWLPIDSKFPLEDYQRLQDAYEQANPNMAEETARQLEIRIKTCAKDIREKYLDPPQTTDFGIMFLPIEGLYAEVLRRPGLFEALQRDFRVIVAGPTILAALLSSLQLGFKTLAIEKRSSEVWHLLGAVKTEFGKFGIILDKTQKKLQEASNTIEDASRRTRSIARKLRSVEQLPAGEAMVLLKDSEEPEDINNDLSY